MLAIQRPAILTGDAHSDVAEELVMRSTRRIHMHSAEIHAASTGIIAKVSHNNI